MAVLAAALRDAGHQSPALKTHALGAWRVFIHCLAAQGQGSGKLSKKEQSGEREEGPLARVSQQSVVVLMEALEWGGEGQAQAASILHEIIVSNKELVKRWVIMSSCPLLFQCINIDNTLLDNTLLDKTLF